MRLFKFVRSVGAVLSMAKGSLKFTPIEELNDASELTPVLNRPAVRDSLELLRRNGMTRDQFSWLHRQEAVLNLLAPEEKVLSAPKTLSEVNHMLSLTAYDNLDYMERKLFATAKLIRERIAILSLTERYDSLPMWAHYADLAKGFVVILDGLEKAFKGDETGSLNVAKPVIYAEQFSGMTFDPSTQDRLFFSKLSDWSYEREWRIVSALSACHRSPDRTLYVRNVDPIHLAGVICGWRSSKSDILSIDVELKRQCPNAKLVSAVLDGGRVRLDSSL